MKLKNLVVSFLLTITATLLLSCGSSNSSGTSSTSATASSSDIEEHTEAAIGSLFSASGQSSLSAESNVMNTIIQAFSKNALASSTLNTCDIFGIAPSQVNASSTGTAGTYGASGDQVTVTASDFCNGLTGTSNPNETLFGSFTINNESVLCGPSSSTQVTVDAAGVFRQRVVDSYYPAIYGEFTITDAGGTAKTYDCSLYLNFDESVNSGTTCIEQGTTTVLSSTNTDMCVTGP